MSAPQPHPGPHGPLWLFFNPIGRISREPYWLAFGLVWALFAIPLSIWLQTLDFDAGVTQVDLADFVDSNPLMPFMLLALQWVELALVIKRLQDRGLTGFLAILVFVPLFNILFIIALGFLPGTPGPNAYGPGPNSRWQRPT
ncbi:DUF805 domain-containing protein [Stappia taiwanensis]|uniref:DUF805 domain-containing protein n=1 Tax=Stappia taiwanensis TaxID=992267 RepID=A0A838XUP4_9HYPH|nr:DUF805 domain-containing protein [Stappia taiwanensis]MBA4612751.1 DUF805 domain-containing protein [Stappia taiwanensis]GGE90359.1 hypothetical protein GCM10007285_17240 [Stappia taiwanensis]